MGMLYSYKETITKYKSNYRLKKTVANKEIFEIEPDCIQNKNLLIICYLSM